MITIEKFGELPDGQIINAYRLHAPNKMTAAILNYGATLQSLCLPNGQDIVLGFDSLNDYLSPHPYFGTAIGRGELQTIFRYALDNEGLRLDMIADSSAPTPVNLTGHSYFNLGDATINDHALSLNAESFCIVDAA